MPHPLARRPAVRESLGKRRGACFFRVLAALFVCVLLAGCAPRGSMDFRIASLEERVMELEEQNQRQASELDARLDKLERYAVAQGVEKDRISASIAASRGDLRLNTIQAARTQIETENQSQAAEDLAVEITSEGLSAEEEPVHPVSAPTHKVTAAAKDLGPGPETPYAEPTAPSEPAVQVASVTPAPQLAPRHKPMGKNLPYAYSEAVRLTRTGKTEKGRQMLRAFIMENPDSPLVPNAYYWLGETYYHDKRYAQAILTFKEVTSRFPKDPKAAASMLKIGYSYEMLEDKDNARFYLNALLKDYPKSEPARLARAALDDRF